MFVYRSHVCTCFLSAIGRRAHVVATGKKEREVIYHEEINCSMWTDIFSLLAGDNAAYTELYAGDLWYTKNPRSGVKTLQYFAPVVTMYGGET